MMSVPEENFLVLKYFLTQHVLDGYCQFLNKLACLRCGQDWSYLIQL
jgi:hypothetical protein